MTEQNIITVGYHKGEMDFGVNCSIYSLTLEQMNELRIMTVVAIGQAEAMWHREREKTQQAGQTLSDIQGTKIV